jgi:predicted neutral ceramidase superfamily lipid hydrolase
MAQQTSLVKIIEETVALIKQLQVERDRAFAHSRMTDCENNEFRALLAQIESTVDKVSAAVLVSTDKHVNTTVASAERSPEAPTEQLEQELQECRKDLEQTKAELEQTKAELKQTKDELEEVEGRMRMQSFKTRRQASQMGKEDWERLASVGQRDSGAFMREIRERGFLPYE